MSLLLGEDAMGPTGSPINSHDYAAERHALPPYLAQAFPD
jgi:hypothetical protein